MLARLARDGTPALPATKPALETPRALAPNPKVGIGPHLQRIIINAPPLAPQHLFLQDHKLRIYCKQRDPRVCAALRIAFRRWSERQAGWGKAQHSTPFKFRTGRGTNGGGAGDNGDAGGGGRSVDNGEGGRATKRARSLNFGEGGGSQPSRQTQQQQQQPPSDNRMVYSPIPE